MSNFDNVFNVINWSWIFVLPLDVTDVTHHNIDDGVLNQAEEHEQGTGGHEHVNGLNTNIIIKLSFFSISHAATFQRMGLLGILLIIS